MKAKQAPLAPWAQQFMNELSHVIVGKEDVLTFALAAVLASGHILIEDVPGVGKTTMALGFSKALDMDYGRVQFTPDVLPSDVTGFSVLDPKTGEMRYQPGAVLCNLFLADELNRATSRTQAALLEAMEEGQVTVDGVSHPLPVPFTIIATQNPTGAAGTQMLPDSQMDRFTVRLSMGYPSPEQEVAMVMDRRERNPLSVLPRVMDRQGLAALQEKVARVHVSDELVTYIVKLITATRQDARLARGASPRATLALTAMAKAMATLKGRDYVVPEDVREVLSVTVAHRLLLSAKAEGQGVTAEQVLSDLANTVAAPKP